MLDDEATSAERAGADVHLAACRSCADWLASARSLRVAPAEVVPDLTVDILTRNPAAPRAATAEVWQLGLAVVALAQLLVALVALLAPDHDLHLAREHGAWELALAVGFATAAWRPSRAPGLVPLVGVLVAGLLVTAGVDGAALSTEGGHLVPLVGFGLLLLESRKVPHHA